MSGFLTLDVISFICLHTAAAVNITNCTGLLPAPLSGAHNPVVCGVLRVNTLLELDATKDY